MANRFFISTIAVLVALIFPRISAFSQDEISGRAIAISGDTLRLKNEEDKSEIEVRLWGIDAPEKNQHCETRTGRSIDCGILAKNALKATIRRKTLTCVDFDKNEEGTITALCYLGDKILHSMVVRSGWAMAYKRESSDYLGIEKVARLAEKGIWQYRFDKPWIWRKRQKKQAE